MCDDPNAVTEPTLGDSAVRLTPSYSVRTARKIRGVLRRFFPRRGDSFGVWCVKGEWSTVIAHQNWGRTIYIAIVLGRHGAVYEAECRCRAIRWTPPYSQADDMALAASVAGAFIARMLTERSFSRQLFGPPYTEEEERDNKRRKEAADKLDAEWKEEEKRRMDAFIKRAERFANWVRAL